VLVQGSRHWTMATGDASGADASISWTLVLPRELKEGSAEFRLKGPAIVTQTSLRLRVQK